MRMSRSPQNGGFHRCTGGRPVFALFPTAPAMASSPAVRVCPSFAMVCLERSSVTGGFPRDRDRTQAYPLATELAGRRRKSYIAQAVTGPAARPVLGRSWHTRMEAGSHLVENSVIYWQLGGFESRRRAPQACLASMLHACWSARRPPATQSRPVQDKDLDRRSMSDGGSRR